VNEMAQPIEIRPIKSALHHPGSGVGVIVWSVAGLLYSLRFHGVTQIAVIAIALAAALAFIGLLSLSRRRTKLTLEDERLAFSGMLRKKRLNNDQGVDEIVDVEVAWGNVSGRRSRLWLLIGGTGRTLVSLNRSAWDHTQLEYLRKCVDLPIKVIDEPKSPREIRHAYPHSLPWWAAYPMIAATGVIVAAAIVIAVAQASLP
jgi:hypothetical protein